jgi:aspartate beta-hydroxylase
MSFKKFLIRIISKIVNRFFDFYTGGRKRPVFFDIDRTAPALRLIDAHYEAIKKEVKVLAGSGMLRNYHEVDQLQHAISAVENPDKNWKVFMLYLMGDFSKTAQRDCAHTCSALLEVPDIYQCFFSILDPGKNIPAHNGLYRGYLRYHIGLEVPAVSPPQLRIKDELYTWADNQSVLFDDSWNHEVINRCKERRIVLVVDIYRPLPSFPDKVNRWITKNLIKRFYAEKVLEAADRETVQLSPANA